MAELLKVKQYLIANEFFEKGYSAGNGPCRCTSHCCTHGVWVDVRERETILQHKALIQQQMDETQVPDEGAWFEGDIEEDADFPSGRCVGTAVINNKCAFLDKRGRCSIQVAASAAGKHQWEWKPLFCILFPVVIENSIVQFDPMLQGEEPCCTIGEKFETPLFAACKEELTYLLGADGYARLEEHYASLQDKQQVFANT